MTPGERRFVDPQSDIGSGRTEGIRAIDALLASSVPGLAGNPSNPKLLFAKRFVVQPGAATGSFDADGYIALQAANAVGIQADVAVRLCLLSTSGVVQAGIIFVGFNDGTSPGPGDRTGDIFARLRISCGGTTNQAEITWVVIRCTDAGGGRLPMIPDERVGDVVYFAPGDPMNRITLNPLAVEVGEDHARAAGDLFTIFKRAVGEEEFGARMSPILANAFKCLVGRPEATLWEVKRLLEDPAFRQEVAQSVDDDYLREFWNKTYPSYPKGSHMPIISRLDTFLGSVPVRRALCSPNSTLSIRRLLAENLILLVDLSGLPAESMLILGQIMLARFQLELHRREAMRQELRESFHLFWDEFQEFAGVAEGTWRGLLSRGRRYGLAMTLAHQHPSQLPTGLQDEIFGTVSSMVVFNVAAKDAQVLRKELLEQSPENGEVRPVAMESLVTLKRGRAIARLGTGALAIPLSTAAPVVGPPEERGEKVRQVSWARFGATT